jgi:hypothetical protein
MPEDVIAIDNLVVRYRGKAALDGLNLRVPRGAVYAFLGDNGAGKTTTMKILTGLAPADTGRATILGLDCWSRATELRHRVGYMPERPRFYEWMSVADIGWFTAAFHRPGFQGRFREWAERLGLDLAKRIKDLSKGGSAWPWRWPRTPRCCSSTSPRPASTSSPAASSWPASPTSPRPAGRCSSPATRSPSSSAPARTWGCSATAR